jgi:diguanylate cyclase (GGDEF)-like protein/PAS domain S-box-containing protein
MQGLTLEINKQAQAHKLQDIVFRISQAAISSSNLDELYQTIHKLLGELISVKNFYIALHDSANDHLLFPYYIDEFDEPVSPIKLGRGLTDHILRTGKPLLVTRPIYQDLIKQGFVEVVGTPAYEWLGVPLKLNNQIIGVMATQSYSEEVHFTQENVDLFEFVSSQIAQTIERKRSEKELVVSRERYYRLFDESPISLWEEDLSKIKRTLDSYKEKGVTDFREFFTNHPEVLVECAKNIKVLDVNKATVDLIGAKNKADVINNFLTTFLDHSYQYFLEEMVLLAEGKTDFNLDGVKQTFDGKRIDVSMKWSVLSESHSDLSKVIISMIDITERRKSESKLTYLSTHDALTGLYNRSFFNEEMARLENEELFPISIIIADVDDLKKTNDYFGHAVGDILLSRTAQALMSSFRVEDVVARIGGDEFAVLLPRTNEITAQNAICRFKEIIQGLNSNSNEIPIRLSIGVSTIQSNGSLKKGFILADENMYLDKQNKPSWSP